MSLRYKFCFLLDTQFLQAVVEKLSQGGPTPSGRDDIIAVQGQRVGLHRFAREKPSFVDLMRQSPLMGVDLQLERDQSLTR